MAAAMFGVQVPEGPGVKVLVPPVTLQGGGESVSGGAWRGVHSSGDRGSLAFTSRTRGTCFTPPRTPAVTCTSLRPIRGRSPVDSASETRRQNEPFLFASVVPLWWGTADCHSSEAKVSKASSRCPTDLCGCPERYVPKGLTCGLTLCHRPEIPSGSEEGISIFTAHRALQIS
jgi:hypothetical protein